jgi:hypothetical protein
MLRIDRVSISWQNEGGDLFCQASALVSYPTQDDNRRLETLTSGGLGGIHPDSSRAYLDAIRDGELDDLREHLTHFGIEASDRDWEVLIAGARD